MAFVALQLALSAWGGIARPSLITALVGLAMGAAGVTLFWSMGLRRESVAARLVILVPIVLSVVLAVALMLDGDFRRAGIRG
jgi:hypothetical protein